MPCLPVELKHVECKEGDGDELNSMRLKYRVYFGYSDYHCAVQHQATWLP
jgi:hypothetical protein